MSRAGCLFDAVAGLSTGRLFRLVSEFLGLVVISLSLVTFTLFRVGNATIVICLGKLRGESDRFGQVGDGLVEFALLAVVGASVVAYSRRV